MLPVCASYCSDDEDIKWSFIQNLAFAWVNLSQQNLRNVEIARSMLILGSKVLENGTKLYQA